MNREMGGLNRDPEIQKFFYSLTFEPMGSRIAAAETANTIVHALAFLNKGEEEVPSDKTMHFWLNAIGGTTAFAWPNVMTDMAMVSSKTPGVKIMLYQVKMNTATVPFSKSNNMMKRQEDQLDLTLAQNTVYYFQDGKGWEDSMITMMPNWDSKTERTPDYDLTAVLAKAHGEPDA